MSQSVVSRTTFDPAKIVRPACEGRRGYEARSIANMRQVRLPAEMIDQAKKPLIMAGHGILLSGAEEYFARFVERSGIPVAFTLLGQSSFPESHPLALGLMGMHGLKHVNAALGECDLLVNIGARFDDRATGKIAGFAPNAKIIHVDIDPAEIGKNVRTDVPVVGDAREALKLLIPEVAHKQHTEWLRWIDSQRDRVLQAALDEHPETPEPYTIIKAIREATNGEAIVTTDVGQHQMWTAQHFGFDHPNRWLTSGGLGTMGYGFPAAVGAQIAHPNRLVVCIAGEASLQMNIQEMGTVSQYRLPVKIFILNNEWMGMVRQWQELTYESRYSNS